MTKRFFAVLLLLLLLTGCSGGEADSIDIAATTGPVAQFARAITDGSGLTVTQVISDSVSCLHDYTLSVRQMQALEQADVVLISGAGLEEAMEDLLSQRASVVDCSRDILLLEAETHEAHEHAHDHDHDHDPHIWLDPQRAALMVANMTDGLCETYPQHEALFRKNAETLILRLQELKAYGDEALQSLSCRQLITFHDGFAYLADSFDLEILAAIEEESGSEASAKDLTEMVHLVREHGLPAVFTERHGSVSAAGIICRETGISAYSLDMAMGGGDYFAAMTANIDALKEALQ